jgi:hypothetical protein
VTADWGKWALRWQSRPENQQTAGETSAAYGDRMVGAFYAQIETTQERMQVGYSAFPENNVGVYYDKRNADEDQPDFIPGRGRTGRAVPMW